MQENGERRRMTSERWVDGMSGEKGVEVWRLCKEWFITGWRQKLTPLLLLLLPAHPVRWLLAYLWTGCCSSLVEGWVNKAAARRWDCLRWMALSQIHSEIHTCSHCAKEWQTKTFTWTNSLGNHFRRKMCFCLWWSARPQRWSCCSVWFSICRGEVGPEAGSKLAVIDCQCVSKREKSSKLHDKLCTWQCFSVCAWAFEVCFCYTAIHYLHASF